MKQRQCGNTPRQHSNMYILRCIYVVMIFSSVSQLGNALLIERHVFPPPNLISRLSGKGRKRVLFRDIYDASCLSHKLVRRQKSSVLSSGDGMQIIGENGVPPGNKNDLSTSNRAGNDEKLDLERSTESSSDGDEDAAPSENQEVPVNPQEELSMWEDSDPYKDLDRLEYAINLANAEQNLQHAERLETLNYMARQRRLLFPDVAKFLVAPLVGALIIARCRTIPFTRPMTMLLTRCIDFHFWSLVVISPILLLLAKRVSTTHKKMPPVPNEVRFMSPALRSLIDFEWEDPKKSCKDYVLCLLEFWVSSVLGLALVSSIVGISSVPIKYRLVRFWMSSAQAVTRVAALASLYQYSGQLFQLEREQQPRPKTWFVSILQPLIQNMRLAAPLGIASDMSKVLVEVEKESLVALYATISTFLVGVSFRLTTHSGKLQNSMNRRSIGNKLIYLLAVAAFWRKPFLNLVHDFQSAGFSILYNRIMRAPLIVGIKCAGVMSMGLIPVLGPLFHIRGISQVINVVHTHDLSLGIDAKEFLTMKGDDDRFEAKRTAWRYRVNWRKQPKRIRQLIREWFNSCGYWWFVKGTVSEQILLEWQEKSRISRMQGIEIFDRVKDDIERYPNRFGTVKTHEEKMSRNMKRIAYKHQRDYERGSYEDPLGVAVYRTLGIGLGYNFDHMRMLDEGEKPSTRRLQARAAKSAIIHMQKLLTNMTEELKGLSGQEKTARRNELNQIYEVEKKYFANRLKRLIPTDQTTDFGNSTSIGQFYKPQKFIKTSSHEMTIDGGPSFGIRSEPILIDVTGAPLVSAELESLEDFAKDMNITDFSEYEFERAYMESTEKEKRKQQQGDEGEEDNGPNQILV